MDLLTEHRTALLGWSIPAMDAAARLNRPFIVVGPGEFAMEAEKYQIPFLAWDFHAKSEAGFESLYNRLEGVELAVPLFEETVEWAGYLNSRYHNDPHIFHTALSLRNKSMMKRRAQLSGLSVGVFEEASEPADLTRFFHRIGELQARNQDPAPIHIKPLDKSGSVGHRVIESPTQVEEVAAELFPCLAESHINGKEFSCEVFVHSGNIRFMNITEYVRLGHAGFVPASTELESLRPLIRQQVERLVQGFDIRYGILHPEFFWTPQGIFFGEVAGRVPGGHIFELIERAYGFSAFEALLLCSDPKTDEDTLKNVFPPENGAKAHAGCLMLYPRVRYVQGFHIPREVGEHRYFEKYHLFAPYLGPVPERKGFGDHYGTVFFAGEDGDEMREILRDFDQLEFFTEEPDGGEVISPPGWNAHRKEAKW